MPSIKIIWIKFNNLIKTIKKIKFFYILPFNCIIVFLIFLIKCTFAKPTLLIIWDKFIITKIKKIVNNS